MREYAQARAAYEGMSDRINEQTVNRNNEINERVARQTNQDDGTVTHVILKGQKGDYYVTSGHVALLDEGRINDAETDTSLTVVDNDGQTRMISPKDIDSVVSQGSAQDLRQSLLDKSEQDQQAQMSLINGAVNFDNGSNFTILNPEGQTQNVSVRADQNGDLFALIDEADGTQSSVPLTDDVKAKLQEMASAHIRDRYEQMEAEIAANNEQGNNEDASQSEQQEEQAQAPEAQEAGPEHAYEQDQQVQYIDADGVAHNGTVLEFDPNGYYIVQFDNPPTGKKLIDSYTEAELDAMTGRESNNSEAAAEAPSTENASSPIVENGMDIFDMPEAAPSSPAPAADTTN